MLRAVSSRYACAGTRRRELRHWCQTPVSRPGPDAPAHGRAPPLCRRGGAGSRARLVLERPPSGARHGRRALRRRAGGRPCSARGCARSSRTSRRAPRPTSSRRLTIEQRQTLVPPEVVDICCPISGSGPSCGSGLLVVAVGFCGGGSEVALISLFVWLMCSAFGLRERRSVSSTRAVVAPTCASLRTWPVPDGRAYSRRRGRRSRRPRWRRRRAPPARRNARRPGS